MGVEGRARSLYQAFQDGSHRCPASPGVGQTASRDALEVPAGRSGRMASHRFSAPGCPNGHLLQARCGAAQWRCLGGAGRSGPRPATCAGQPRPGCARQAGQEAGGVRTTPRAGHRGSVRDELWGLGAAWVGHAHGHVRLHQGCRCALHVDSTPSACRCLLGWHGLAVARDGMVCGYRLVGGSGSPPVRRGGWQHGHGCLHVLRGNRRSMWHDADVWGSRRWALRRHGWRRAVSRSPPLAPAVAGAWCVSAAVPLLLGRVGFPVCLAVLWATLMQCGVPVGFQGIGCACLTLCRMALLC